MRSLSSSLRTRAVRSGIGYRSRIPVLNRFRVLLTLSDPGMTTCADARAITRVLRLSSLRTRAKIRGSPSSSFRTRAARSGIGHRSRIPVLNRFRVPLTLRVSGPGMTSCVDARAIIRVLPRSSFRTQRDPQSVTAVGLPHSTSFAFRLPTRPTSNDRSSWPRCRWDPAASGRYCRC